MSGGGKSGSVGGTSTSTGSLVGCVSVGVSSGGVNGTGAVDGTGSGVTGAGIPDGNGSGVGGTTSEDGSGVCGAGGCDKTGGKVEKMMGRRARRRQEDQVDRQARESTELPR